MALLLNLYRIPVDFPWWFYDISGGFLWNFWRDAMKNRHGAGHATTLPGLEKESKHPVPRSDDCPKSVEAEVIFDDSQVVTSPGLEKTSPGLESENRVFLWDDSQMSTPPKAGNEPHRGIVPCFPKSSCLLFCCESLADPPWASRMWPQIGNLTVALWRLRRANMTGTHLPFDIFSRMWLDEFQILQGTKMLGTGQWRCSRTRWRCSKTSSAGGHCRGAVYLLEVGGSKKKRRNSTELKKSRLTPFMLSQGKAQKCNSHIANLWNVNKHYIKT